jgi:hypothetical protein
MLFDLIQILELYTVIVLTLGTICLATLKINCIAVTKDFCTRKGGSAKTRTGLYQHQNIISCIHWLILPWAEAGRTGHAFNVVDYTLPSCVYL